jgi:DNA transformation protein and related proteins
MSARQNPFVAHCLELLSPLGATRAKSMFGGHGLYVDELFVALVAFDRLYLKTNHQTQPRFEAQGCTPFTYEANGKSMRMAYYTVPDEALDSPALMQPWARLALQAALAARASKAPKKRLAARGGA